ncbi:unnamed protein product [Protopolystoma xenopodis]|uniref:Uncharacterized protein n=1 Tax=Protopolystoma xenopodis TaxID=117903 RepID=A0A448XK91_9PLAT|nr:unnamed protein product [Protopolystoma xenopodis]
MSFLHNFPLIFIFQTLIKPEHNFPLPHSLSSKSPNESSNVIGSSCSMDTYSESLAPLRPSSPHLSSVTSNTELQTQSATARYSDTKPNIYPLRQQYTASPSRPVSLQPQSQSQPPINYQQHHCPNSHHHLLFRQQQRNPPSHLSAKSTPTQKPPSLHQHAAPQRHTSSPASSIFSDIGSLASFPLDSSTIGSEAAAPTTSNSASTSSMSSSSPVLSALIEHQVTSSGLESLLLLRLWLQITFELEEVGYANKKAAAELQLAQAREGVSQFVLFLHRSSYLHE